MYDNAASGANLIIPGNSGLPAVPTTSTENGVEGFLHTPAVSTASHSAGSSRTPAAAEMTVPADGVDDNSKTSYVTVPVRSSDRLRQKKELIEDRLDRLGEEITEEIYMLKVSAKKGKLNSEDCNWAAAEAIRGSIATEKIDAELEQICTTFAVAEPVTHYVENYHFCHDLYNLAKDKARLVMGKLMNSMIFDAGPDTSSPTINSKIIYLMLSICIELDFELEVWDCKAAFLQAPLLSDSVYVKVRPNIAERMVKLKDWWKKSLRKDGSLMLHVNKGWYGHPLSNLSWAIEIANTLINDCGFIQHEMEPCLFYKGEGRNRIYILLHVDDMGVISIKYSTERTRVFNILEKKYGKLKLQSGDDVVYIGYELHRDRYKKRWDVCMSKFLTKVGAVHNITDADCVNITNPAKDVNFSKPLPLGHADNTPFNDTMLYRSLVMSMQYGTTVIPSCKYHVIFLATKQCTPCIGDYKKALHVLKYMILRKTKGLRIYGYGEMIIYVYPDAAFDVYLDSKSHSGIAIFIGNAGAALYCSSNKQKCVTSSSTGAEVVAADAAIVPGAYYKDLLAELGIKCKVVYYEDNTSCITLVKTGCASYDRTSRHMIRKINLMHEYFEDPLNEATQLWCHTLDMCSDTLSKDKHGPSFGYQENILMGHEVEDILELD